MLALPALAVLAAFALPTLQPQRARRRSTGSRCSSSPSRRRRAGSSTWRCTPARRPSSPPTSPSCRSVTRASSRRWRWSSPSPARSRGSGSSAGARAAVAIRSGKASSCRPVASPVCWLLAMTLLLPPLDNARSYRSMVQRISKQVPTSECIAAPHMPRAEVVALRVPRRLSGRRGHRRDGHALRLSLPDGDRAGSLREVAALRAGIPKPQQRRRHPALSPRRPLSERRRDPPQRAASAAAPAP